MADAATNSGIPEIVHIGERTSPAGRFTSDDKVHEVIEVPPEQATGIGVSRSPTEKLADEGFA